MARGAFLPVRYCSFVLTALLLANLVLQAQTYNVVYGFGTDPNDPYAPQPIGLVSQGRDGRLYTTSQLGGSKTGKQGTAFAVTTSGALTRLWDFDPYPSPAGPWSGLTMGTDGNFYGTTSTGGAHAVGTVFRVTSDGQFTVLWDFTASTDEGVPEAGLVLGTDGNFYGTTVGVYAGTYGTAYKITPKGKLTTIHAFKFSDGATPYQLILGLDGYFYGITRGGGANDMGVIFRMSKSGAVKVLHSFSGYPNDGKLPIGFLAQGNDGTLYGTTYLGGSKNWGVVFKISPTGKGYTVLHNFDRNADINEGINPLAGMALGIDGNLYGTTGGGGKQNSGALFRITPAGQYTTLYSFCPAGGCHDGFYPQTAMTLHTNGTLYGETESGGPNGNYGVVFSLNVGLGPFVSLVTTTGGVGSTVQILGQGLNGTTAVKVGGSSANFNIASDTYMTATVPAGTSGFVTVTTSGVTLTSSRKFFVTPAISTFTPTSGPVGTQVTISGKGLINASKVAFGSRSASFVVKSDLQVVATVPTGAVTSKIAITTPGGKATSKTVFTVTQ